MTSCIARPFMLLLLLAVPSLAQDRDRDLGIDTAQVTATNANLRAAPSASARVIFSLPRGELLALLSREPDGLWYNVIHVESGEEGWIHQSVIQITYTQNPRRGPLFQAERQDDYSDPTISIKNDSHKTLNLKVGDELYKIDPYNSRSVTFEPGSYSYYASAPGVLPAIGEHEFKSGYRYTWTFFIKTVRR